MHIERSCKIKLNSHACEAWSAAAWPKDWPSIKNGYSIEELIDLSHSTHTQMYQKLRWGWRGWRCFLPKVKWFLKELLATRLRRRGEWDKTDRDRNERGIKKNNRGRSGEKRRESVTDVTWNCRPCCHLWPAEQPVEFYYSYNTTQYANIMTWTYFKPTCHGD